MGSMSGPFLKLGGAKFHLGDLTAKLDAAKGNRLYGLVCEPDLERDQYVVKIRKGEKDDETWPLIFGDFVRNLRSTLDHITYELAGRPTARVLGSVDSTSTICAAAALHGPPQPAQPSGN